MYVVWLKVEVLQSLAAFFVSRILSELEAFNAMPSSQLQRIISVSILEFQLYFQFNPIICCVSCTRFCTSSALSNILQIPRTFHAKSAMVPRKKTAAAKKKEQEKAEQELEDDEDDFTGQGQFRRF
jgi:hypothetical protein